MGNEKQTLTALEFSERHGIPVGTLANLRYRKAGPKFYKCGRKVLYKVTDIEAWLYQNPVMTVDSHFNR